MNQHNFYFMIAVAIFFAVHTGMAIYYFAHSRRSSGATWDELMSRLVQTDRAGICMVAGELVDEWGEPKFLGDDEACEEQALPGTAIEATELWRLLGGLEGLEAMERNSDVIIEIAAYVQRWYPQAIVIAERLRLDARELRWHVSRLKGAAKTGNLQVSFPFYARRAVVTYYMMTRRVLRLCEAGQFAMLSQLQQAL